MSHENLHQELENYKNMVKVANAKISAINHTLGTLMGENNDLKATNILYQEREKELAQKNSQLNDFIMDLQKQLEDSKKSVTDGLINPPEADGA